MVIGRPMTVDQAGGLQFIEKMDSGMRLRFRQSVVPLYGYAPEHDHHRLLGTANLVSVAGRYFVVTASHVAQATYEHGLQRDDFYVPNLFDGSFVAIQGNLTGDKSNENDVAFLELERPVVEKLAGHRFLTLADTDNSTAPLSRGWYYVHGYPIVGAGFDPKAKAHGATPFTHSTSMYEGPTSFLPIFDPVRHVLVELDPNDATDTHGRRAALPSDLKGISGSAIWRSFSHGEDATTWTPDAARVVAIETAVVRNAGRTIVRGTRWFVVLALLRHAFADLAPAIELHLSSPVTLRERE